MPFPYPEDSAAAIHTVLFDYGQVLSNPPDPAAWARMLTLTGIDEAPLHAAYWAFRHDYDRGALTGPAYWQEVATRAGFPLTPERLTALFAADVDLWTSLNLPMVEWAGRLQTTGMRTGILSNIGDSIAEGIVAKLPWLSRFDHCTWSHALFMAKPEPAIYLKTAAALHTEPAHILFIDDREENVAAAVTLGFDAIHYTTHPAFEQGMRDRGLSSLLTIGPPEPIADRSQLAVQTS